MLRAPVAWCLLLAAMPAAPAGAETTRARTPLARRLQALADNSPVARRAFWGARVVDTGSGAVLLENNAGHFFVPASNAKLFSTALALMRLGPDHRFHTVVLADQSPDADGTLHGDLRLVGGGDPTLSARAIPYSKDAAAGNPLAALEDLAGQVAARGVRRVEGGIVGDDTAYVWEPYAEGWAQDDTLWEYGAPVGALSFNDNALALEVSPGQQPGEPVRLALTPPLDYFLLDNRVRTGKKGEQAVHFERPPGSREVRVWGTAGSRSVHLLAVEDPARFAAWAFRDALARRGVVVSGGVATRHRLAAEVADLKSGVPQPPVEGVEMARRTSPPLVETLKIINKVSQNLHAEIVLREVARVRRNMGSRQAGLEEMRAFLAEIGISPQDAILHDGSGLSRLNLVTPRALTTLLEAMHRSPYREAWIDLMPVGGEDGTLAERFGGSAPARRIRAKTGTMTGVNALSGYAQTAGGRLLAFSILVNNSGLPSSAARRFIDTIVLTLAEWR